ncbi:MAG: PDZ domain-containing protein, partial [bacterium]|nr:PDZ domain-containing protein [bacterium]
MIKKGWKPTAAGCALALLVLGCGTATAAVLPDDPAPAEAQEPMIVKVEKVQCPDEARVQVKVMGDGEGEHVVQWVGCPTKRGFLGVALNALSPELQQHFGAPEETGVLVGSVVEESPAQAAGLRVGDVITAIDGERITSAADVQRLIR